MPSDTYLEALRRAQARQQAIDRYDDEEELSRTERTLVNPFYRLTKPPDYDPLDPRSQDFGPVLAKPIPRYDEGWAVKPRRDPWMAWPSEQLWDPSGTYRGLRWSEVPEVMSDIGPPSLGERFWKWLQGLG